MEVYVVVLFVLATIGFARGRTVSYVPEEEILHPQSPYANSLFSSFGTGDPSTGARDLVTIEKPNLYRVFTDTPIPYSKLYEKELPGFAYRPRSTVVEEDITNADAALPQYGYIGGYSYGQQQPVAYPRPIAVSAFEAPANHGYIGGYSYSNSPSTYSPQRPIAVVKPTEQIPLYLSKINSMQNPVSFLFF